MNAIKYFIGMLLLTPAAFIILIGSVTMGFNVYFAMLSTLTVWVGLPVLVALEPRNAKH